jgi:hypothetical protein
MAKRLGVSNATYTRMENAGQNVTLGTLTKVCRPSTATWVRCFAGRYVCGADRPDARAKTVPAATLGSAIGMRVGGWLITSPSTTCVEWGPTSPALALRWNPARVIPHGGGWG